MTHILFPALEDWEGTKSTLHAYSKVVGAIPRTHADPHPKWWQISLKVQPDGLITDHMALPDGGNFFLKINFQTHTIDLLTSLGMPQSWSMKNNLTANDLAGEVFQTLRGLGLQGEYARNKFENDEPRPYNPAHAETYFSVLVNVASIFEKHRATLTGERGPVQLWPHGFDLAFEWFGTRMIEYEEHGEKASYPSQINLGFSPGEPSHPRPYFYSNPFPFDEHFLAHPLPYGARWFTESWKGSLLEYAALEGDPQGGGKLQDYARAVFEISSPALLSESAT